MSARSAHNSTQEDDRCLTCVVAVPDAHPRIAQCPRSIRGIRDRPKAQSKIGTSVLIGHTHRAGVFHRTNRLGDHAAYENGCLCRLDGLGYANFPDWQQAFSVVDVFPGGMFNVTLLRILSRRCFIYGDTVVRRRK